MSIKWFNISQRTAFIICALILAGSALGKRAIINTLQIYLRKEPIELKASFDDLNEDRLGDYRVVRKSKIENPDILRELGTEDYIIWELEDISVDKTDNTRFCSLFVTYYTGINDRIPHVPEECYFGAGNRVKRTVDDSLFLERNGESEQIDYRRIVFTSRAENIWGSGSEFTVCYILRVNGQYAGNRTAARNIMARNLFGKYSYLSKVEWRFNGAHGTPTEEEVARASERLLAVILPIFEQDHWPDISE